MPDDPPARPAPGPAGAAQPAKAGVRTGDGSAVAGPGEVPGGATSARQGGGGSAVGDKAGFRLAAFGAVLIVVLFAGYGLGRLNNGTASATAPPAAVTGNAMSGMVMDESQPHTHNVDGTVTQSGAAMPVGSVVGGLSLSSGGLTLVPETTTFTAGRRQKLAFRITVAGGAPVTSYAIVHDKPLHLVVIRRDLAGFQHLHPTMAPDGTWSIDLTLADPGIYRMIADFTAIVGGKPVATTLGSDLTVAGDYAPIALPAPARTATTTDGFTATYEGTPSTKSTQPILVTVTAPGGRPAALEPYLGAFGHLVVLREGDLAYLHVHPEPQLVEGKVKFWLAVPSAGTYRMFFDFQSGQVHTAAWTTQITQ
jgi:hypothetical protein